MLMKSGLFNVSLLYKVHRARNHAPPIGICHICDTATKSEDNVRKIFLVEVVASDFFQFIQGFNVEEGYMNTYTGDIGLKIESEDIIDNSGLTVLHPYYSNITLLPFK